MSRLKLIHCADLHLDSAMDTHLSKEKARERKNEILDTFGNMISYADRNDIKIILIAGDMFDKKAISATARKYVQSQIETHPEISFYYLKGNHDADGFLNKLDEIPSNLFTFDESWTKYTLATGSRELVLAGAELSSFNSSTIYNDLFLEPKDFNIVMLHGQDSNYQSKDKAEVIGLGELKNKSIDYLALGHVHSYKMEALDGRGAYCYPGCLEGRGFDECGSHGFVVLDIDLEQGELQSEFVAIAKRNTYEVEIDITGLDSNVEIINKVADELRFGEPSDEDLVKLVLCGEVSIDCEKDTELIAKHFENEYYFIKCVDKSKLHVDYSIYQYDKSLKGEFVRAVMEDMDLADDEKARVIQLGIRALSGEVLD